MIGMKAEIEMKVCISGAQRRAALQLNANPHQNIPVRIAALVVHGILRACQQLLQHRNEWLTLRVLQILSMHSLAQSYS